MIGEQKINVIKIQIHQSSQMYEEISSEIWILMLTKILWTRDEPSGPTQAGWARAAWTQSFYLDILSEKDPWSQNRILGCVPDVAQA